MVVYLFSHVFFLLVKLYTFTNFFVYSGTHLLTSVSEEVFSSRQVCGITIGLFLLEFQSLLFQYQRHSCYYRSSFIFNVLFINCTLVQHACCTSSSRMTAFDFTIVVMPVCEGRPDGPCPDKRNDRAVRATQGDLFLCEACDKFRFPTTTKDLRTGGSKALRKSSKSSVDNTNESTLSLNESQSAARGNRPKVTLSASAGVFISTASASPLLIIDELMAYVSYYRNKSNVESLRRCVLSFYAPIVISVSKKLLVDQFASQLPDCPFLAERRSSTTRAAHEAEIEDIVNIIDVLDSSGVFDRIKFVASDLDNLPKFGPEEINIAAVVERQVRVEASINDISLKVQELSSTQRSGDQPSHDGPAQAQAHSTMQSLMSDMQNKLEVFSQSITARLDHWNAVCSNSLRVNNSVNNSIANGNLAAKPSVTVDRKMNVIIFGIKESSDAEVWRKSVNDALMFVCGHSVDIVDAFRLGRFNAAKTRPILVKLRTLWDKRLILSKAAQLKQYGQRNVFVVADEPIEVRRQQTMDRLKYRAERAGKRVFVDNGILSINDVAEYSLTDGSLTITTHG